MNLGVSYNGEKKIRPANTMNNHNKDIGPANID